MSRPAATKAHRAAVSILVTVCMALSGCSGGSDPLGDSNDIGGGLVSVLTVAEARIVAEERGYSWESSILQDDVITAGEYEQAYDRFMKCQEDLGWVFDRPKFLSPVNGLQWQALAIDWRGTGDPPTADLEDRCEVPFFLLEFAYLHTTAHRMDPALRSAFVACLDEHGLEHRGDETNFNEFTSHLSDAEYLADSEGTYQYCLTEEAVGMYPELLWISLGR